MNFPQIAGIFIVFLIFLIFFLLFRFLVLWYFRINDIANTLEALRDQSKQHLEEQKIQTELLNSLEEHFVERPADTTQQ